MPLAVQNGKHRYAINVVAHMSLVSAQFLVSGLRSYWAIVCKQQNVSDTRDTKVHEVDQAEESTDPNVQELSLGEMSNVEVF